MSGQANIIEKEGTSFGLLRRFARDQRGVGAIEFAILFPVLLMLYLGAFELTVGLSVSNTFKDYDQLMSIAVSYYTYVARPISAPQTQLRVQ